MAWADVDGPPLEPLSASECALALALARRDPDALCAPEMGQLAHRALQRLATSASAGGTQRLDPEALDAQRDALDALAALARSAEARPLLLEALEVSGADLERRVLAADRAGDGGLGDAVLLLLLRLSDYGLSAADVVELVDGDAERLLLLVRRCLRVRDLELEAVCALAALMPQLLQPAPWFLSAEDAKREHSLTEFSAVLDSMIEATMSLDVVETWSEVLSARFLSYGGDGDGADDDAAFLRPATQRAIGGVLRWLDGLCQSRLRAAVTLRQYLLLSTSLAALVLVPHCTRAAELLDDRRLPSLSPRQVDSLSETTVGVVRLFVIVSFRCQYLPCLRPRWAALLGLNVTSILLDCKRWLQGRPQVLALVLLYNVNLDALAQADGAPRDLPPRCSPDYLVSAVVLACYRLSLTEAHVVLDLLESAVALPVARDRASYMLVWHALLMRLADEGSESGAVLGSPVPGSPAAAAKLESPAPDSPAPDSPAPAKRSAAPDSPAAAKPSAKASAESPQRKPQSKQGKESEESRESKEAERAFRLLGDLPALGPRPPGAMDEAAEGDSQRVAAAKERRRRRRQRKKREKAEASAAAASSSNRPGPGPPPADAPAEFLCALNGHVMAEPVRAPGGLVFERATIAAWVDEHGTNPVSGANLAGDALEPLRELQTRISEWHIQRTVAGQGEDDLYSF